MIDTVNYQVEFSPLTVQDRSKKTIPTLSMVLFEFNSFRKEVSFFRTHFQGPDYFNFCDKISELQFLLDSIIKKLINQVGDLNIIPYRTLSSSLEYPSEKIKVAANTDKAGIALIVVGLANLIQTSRKAALVAGSLEEFQVKSLLLDFEKELEKSRWLFCLFSKY
jgi:DNA-binding ferritin-like protein